MPPPHTRIKGWLPTPRATVSWWTYWKEVRSLRAAFEEMLKPAHSLLQGCSEVTKSSIYRIFLPQHVSPQAQNNGAWQPRTQISETRAQITFASFPLTSLGTHFHNDGKVVNTVPSFIFTGQSVSSPFPNTSLQLPAQT